MPTATHWHFDGDGVITVSRIPPLPRTMVGPINNLRNELTSTRQGMEDFLEAWRDHKRRKNPGEVLVGSHCEIRITGELVYVAPRRQNVWTDATEAWIPLVAVEDMFAAYAAWAFGGSGAPVEARQGGSA